MKSLKEQIENRCPHYTAPFHNNRCAKGVKYRELVGGPRQGWLARLPCVFESPLKKQPVAKCEHIRKPTEREVDEELKEIDRMINCAENAEDLEGMTVFTCKMPGHV